MAQFRVRRVVVIGALAVAAALVPCRTVVAQAEPRYERPVNADQGDEEGGRAIVWVGTVATNLFYIPAKVVWAGLGGLIGSFAWAITGFDAGAAKSVWGPTTGGNYLVTPAMLEGKEEVHFFGQ